MKKNRFSHPYDGPAARAGVYAGPAAHRGVGGGRPSSIKLEDCTHNGVHYESPSLGTCWLHQMTFDYNQKSTIGFCAEHRKGMGWSLEGQTWGNQAHHRPYRADHDGLLLCPYHRRVYRPSSCLGRRRGVGQRLFLDYECLGAGYHLALSGWPADGPGHRLRRGVGLRL